MKEHMEVLRNCSNPECGRCFDAAMKRHPKGGRLPSYCSRYCRYRAGYLRLFGGTT